MLCSAAEDVDARPYFDLFETGFDDKRLELCFQQSTGYSAGPQIDIRFHIKDRAFCCAHRSSSYSHAY
ncbi:hypothetical protein ACFLU6_15890 [Acidobacteriota bacterium]